MKSREFKNIEWGILVVAIILTIIGIVALFSATYETGPQEFQKQIIYFVMSVFVMTIFMVVDYTRLIKIAPYLYVGVIISLVAVLFTTPINGASSWFDVGVISIQPSEFAKIAVILFMTYSIIRIQAKNMNNINKILNLMILGVISLIPLALIVMQPDYGTSLAIVAAIGMILYGARINMAYVIAAVIIACIAVPVAYLYLLPDHAKIRIDVFLDPELDPRGAGYNIIQSKIALGSGGLTGMGYLERKSNTIRLLVSKNNRFYIRCNRRGNGICCVGIDCNIVSLLDNKMHIYSKNG